MAACTRTNTGYTETLVDVLHPSHAGRTAVVLPEAAQALTFAQLAHEVSHARDALSAAGLGCGDVVAMVLPNCLEFVVCWLATTNGRSIAAPLNPDYRLDEFKFYLEDTEAKAVIVPRGGRAAVAVEAAQQLRVPVWETWAEVDAASGRVHVGLESVEPLPVRRATASELRVAPEPEDVALFLHTSGTTGRPKGVPLTHRNLVTNLRNISRHYRLTPEDRSLIVMPLFHVHGLIGCLLSTLYSGGSVVIQPGKFSATTFWRDFLSNECTWYSAVPTIHQILLARADKDYTTSGKLRFIRSCSSALAPAVFKQLEERFKAPVIEAYAMTENSHQMTSNQLPPGKRKPGSVGQGTGVEVTIRDDSGKELAQGEKGEVCLRGPTVTRGYHNNPQANKTAFHEGRWFRTGDQGFFDEDKFLVLTGRIKELINRGGEKIAPSEIDSALLSHPDVSEAVSFGVPSDKYGEEVEAAVVLKGGREGGKAVEEAILKHCHAKLAAYKCPRRLYIAKDLPRTATGKIQRRHVATHFLNKAADNDDKSPKKAKL